MPDKTTTLSPPRGRRQWRSAGPTTSIHMGRPGWSGSFYELAIINDFTFQKGSGSCRVLSKMVEFCIRPEGGGLCKTPGDFVKRQGTS